jgi:hypothetical protein
MKLNQFIRLTLSGLLAIGLAACGSSSSDKEKNASEFDDAEGLEEQIEELIYNIPPPSEIPYLLQAV